MVGRQIHDADLVEISVLLQLVVAVLGSKHGQKGTLHTCNLTVFSFVAKVFCTPTQWESAWVALQPAAFRSHRMRDMIQAQPRDGRNNAMQVLDIKASPRTCG